MEKWHIHSGVMQYCKLLHVHSMVLYGVGGGETESACAKGDHFPQKKISPGDKIG